MDFNRDELRALHSRSSIAGATVFAFDAAAFATCTLCSLAGSVALRIAFSLAAGLFMALLFVVGHDACHQALTPRRWLNRLIGTFAFLPSLHAYGLWDLAHNRIHHRFTNRRGLDYVWEPLSPAEFWELPCRTRVKYRFYRTAAGHLFYYGFEVWWRKLFWPRPAAVGGYRTEYVCDLALVTGWLVGWPFALLAAKERLGSPTALTDAVTTIGISGVLPFFAFNALMSSVIFLHHIHPAVEWYRADDPIDLEAAQRRSAVHIDFPGPVNWVFHRIMEHTAHHLRPGIPLYRLFDAQTVLENRTSDIVVQKWSIRFHREVLARCKLFDLDRRCWTGYDGCQARESRQTSQATKTTASPPVEPVAL